MVTTKTSKHRFQWYQELSSKSSLILAEAKQLGKDFGTSEFDKHVGLYSASSSCPSEMPDFVLRAISDADRSAVPMVYLWDELRSLVKDIFGDEYDCAVTNTCESALRVIGECLFAPPIMRRGEAYRGRYIVPYTEDYDFIGGYGRPFPPKYKNLFIDRTVSAGELAVEAKTLTNVDCVIVRQVGARYESHGIRYTPTAFLGNVNVEATAARMAEAAERHASHLVGFQSLAYDTFGYGHSDKDESGSPRLLRAIGKIAKDYDVPFVADAASCLPIIGIAPKDIGADVMTWSMDKVAHAPIGGLIVGTEETMDPIRKGLGIGGHRYGTVSSHGKAAFSYADPGRHALAGIIAVLRTLHDAPDRFTKPIDDMFSIVVEAFQSLKPSRYLPDLVFTKSYTMGGIEVNYSNSWKNGEFGIPIFVAEDMFANSDLIMSAMQEMGVYPATVYAGNVFLSPGFGNLDKNGELRQPETKAAARALVGAINLVCKHAGLS